MQLLKLTLRLPGCLTAVAVDSEGDLPCTLVRLAPSTLTRTAAHMLASAIEEEATEAAADRLRETIYSEEDAVDHEAEGGAAGGGGVFVLPLAPSHEHEPISQLFVFGQLPDPEAIHRAAKACGLELAMADEGAISSFTEAHLQDVGLRLLQKHLAAQGFVRVFDSVYVQVAQLLDPPSLGTPATAPRFLEGFKILPLLDARTTAPFAEAGGSGGGEPGAGPGAGGGGVLGLAISFEPQVYKWVPVDWAAIQGLADRRRQEREEQRRLVRKGQGGEADEEDGEEGCGYGVHSGGHEEDELLQLLEDNEVAMELVAVKALPGLTGHGFITSLPTPTPAPSGLLRANQWHGFDLHIPTTEDAMRRFWQHAYNINLPAGPLEYTRIRFRGQDFGRGFTYPTACLCRDVALSFSRTTQAYTRLSRMALELLGSMPGVIQATYHSRPSIDNATASVSSASATPARPAVPTSAAMLALTPVKVGRAQANVDEHAAGRFALTSARQIRDRAKAQGVEDGRETGGMPLLLPTKSATAAAIPSTEEQEQKAGQAPRPAVPTITTGRGAAPAAAAAAKAAAAAAAPSAPAPPAPPMPQRKQARMPSLFEDDELAGGGPEEDADAEGFGGEGEAGPPAVPTPTTTKKAKTPSASALMPPPPKKPKPKAQPKAKAKAPAAAAAAGAAAVGDGAGAIKRKEAGGAGGGKPTKKAKTKAAK